MKTIRVRFLYHKPIGERGVGKLIVGYTWFLALFHSKWKCLKYNYSHEECWLPSDLRGKFIEDFGIAGVCFSATTRGNSNGVRFEAASKILSKPWRWDVIECEVELWRYEVGVQEAEKLIGLKYDYGYILSFLQPFILQRDQKWACSEVEDWLKYLWRLIDKRHKRISPRRAAYVLSKKWGEPVPLTEVLKKDLETRGLK